MKTPILAMIGLTLVTTLSRADEMKAFPPAGKGMTRHVIVLPTEKDEDGRRVQILVGRTVRVDERNTYFFTGHIEEEDIPGWGYTRYVVEKLGPMAGTLMAVAPDKPKVERFISLRGEPYLIRYNSRLPVVVYVPEGAEVRYRIWRASDKLHVAPQG